MTATQSRPKPFDVDLLIEPTPENASRAAGSAIDLEDVRLLESGGEE